MSRRSAYADRLLEFPELVFIDGAEFRRRGTWRAFFSERIGPAFDHRLTFEIGCNDASLLMRVAAQHPSSGFIGIDWKCRALHSGARQIAEAGLRNAVLLHGRAQDIGRIFADGELDEIWLFHPDPCDKPRELNNRLFAASFLCDAHAVLRDRASLVLKTDHAGYYESALNLAGDEKIAMRWNVASCSSDFWADKSAIACASGKAVAGHASEFEQRFRRKHRPIHYLELVKRAVGGGEST